MTVGDYSRDDLLRVTRAGRLRLRVGPFLIQVRSSLSQVVEALGTLYAAHPAEPDGNGGHFVVRIDPPTTLRRFFRAQVQFELDGRRPFIPLPIGMAAAMFEAGLNWCVGTGANQYLALHAATLQRHGRALVMPAPPGSGKSTLCAALMTSGWTLLSDEFALIEPATGRLVPVPRPVALKDQSIPIIQRWAPDLHFGPRIVNNEGQTVSYVRPPADALASVDQRPVPAWVVLPKYVAGSEVELTQLTRANTVMHLANNSFNFNLHGEQGFQLLADIADVAPARVLQYSQLDDGVRAVNELAESSL